MTAKTKVTTTSPSSGGDGGGGAEQRQALTEAVPASTPKQEVELLRRMKSVYVRRAEDKRLGALLQDMVVRTMAEPEARAVIVAAPSGAGKTTLIRSVAADNPSLSLEGPRPGMLHVQVPSPCTLADLGTEIARAAGQPVRDGLKAPAAWGIAMRTVKTKGIRFIWLDEVHNITWDSNVKQARKIRNTIKTALINIRHTVGIVLSGDTSILPFLLEDRHVTRRADRFALPEIGKERHRLVAGTVRELAMEAGLETTPDLQTAIVPRLLHASLGQFGTSVSMTRITIVRALRTRDRSGRPPKVLTREHFAANWAQETQSDAPNNPFVDERWFEIDCAAIVGRDLHEPPAASRKARKRG